MIQSQRFPSKFKFSLRDIYAIDERPLWEDMVAITTVAFTISASIECGRILNYYFIFFQTCNTFVDVMAGVYTEETLQPLNKTQLMKLFLKTQEQTNNAISTLTEEIK